ncbi:UDP-N-acetylmuramoyl-L-alanyl-D-glutamate--2,6-diaminopimelate ligase [Pseudohoeflea coraliihabitans]|uniref:UDP-N-acetylmuramoyl-L-alanyl-D-glutamate--2,6-diaminopimelate ligase n=1 Tax=Pseudohoeflea coraliihabitans TaxID=2860393 RepID=A0ABS6WJ11_9HYPH|nr:UDP-N-acetylmuramoyl-L-alanyl-D-glutamate--2,6-diaminopimelate ligase [Pseudohoeflea sp. DP4N28-3]MBW3095926.1 UDP-N-acetylmuramoyl-L-alanyl-D-glutamate--2,6-diaminopimelate ligase [Pseudohoeflea sp. DP4N28-3]
MKLSELLRALPEGALTIPPADGAELSFSGLCADSRTVQPGDLFFALPGTKVDGGRYVAEAALKGAVAVVASSDAELFDSGLPIILADDPRQVLARAAAAFFGLQPRVIGAVTGTAGKTSVASFLRQIWAHAGEAAAMIGTTGVIAPGRRDYGALTTPDPVALQRLLAELASAGVSHAAMEASSHGLVQRRLDGVALAVAGFTNLGRDHLDYHTDMDDYFAAKMRLFDTLLPRGEPAVIFADDAWSERAVTAAERAGAQVLSVGRKGGFLALKRVEHRRHAQVGEIHHDGRIFEVHLPLAGDFQFANALVAAGMAMGSGVSVDTALEALESLEGASGRLDLVGATPEGAPCYVDYAHKPEALENVLSAVRPFTTGRVVVVFGCGGDRDRGKRPIMGEIASRLADVTIVTDDNPRSETPSAIRAEILAAASGAREIGDRGEAIRAAVAMLAHGDTLIVAGKGHEEGQTVGATVHPFSDHAEIRKALAALPGAAEDGGGQA